MYFLKENISNEALSEIQSYKGVFFVLFSSFLIYNVLKKKDKIANNYTTKLKKNQKQYQDLFKNMSHGVIYATPNGIITSVNKATLDILGIAEKEMIGKSLFDATWKPINSKGEVIDLNKNPTQRTIRNKKPILNTIVGVISFKTGLYVWLKINVIPEFENGDLEPFRVFVTIDDITELKNYQQELEDSKKQINESLKKTQFNEFLLKEASNLAKLGAYELYLDKQNPYYSDELYDFFKIPFNKEFSLERMLKVVTEKSNTILQKGIKNCMESGIIMDEVLDLKMEDGSRFWIRAIIKPIYNKTNEIIGRRGVLQDITDQKKAEEKILLSEQRFKALVQDGYDLYAIVDKKGIYTYMSPSSTKIIGLPPEVFIGRNAFEFLHPNDMERAQESLKKIINQDRVVMEHYRAKNNKNEYRWVETVLTNMLDNPAVKGIVINSRDITQEVEEKRHLKLLESVITHTNDAIIITEAEPVNKPGPRIIYVNDSFTKMTGYTAAEVIGKTPRILQGPKSDEKELAKLSKAIRNWEPYEITTINYKKNGDEFWVNFSVVPVADEKGWYTHWISIERDVTESKIAKQKLIEAKEKAEENERRMNEAQKIAQLGSWYYDVINKVSEWSEETYNIWGFDPENTLIELVDHQERIHPKDWEYFIDTVDNATQKGIPYKMELELIMPDTSKKIINAIAKPIFNEKNQVIAFKGTTQDITERIEIENELRSAKEKAEESEYSIREAGRMAKIGYWGYDKEKDIISWSEEIHKIYGTSSETGVPNLNEILSFFTEKSKKEIVEATIELASNGTPYELELNLINKKNENIWIRNLGQPVYNKRNEIIGRRGVSQNITSEKNAQLALLKAKEKAERSQNTMNQASKLAKIGYWYQDLVKNTLTWSDYIYQLYKLKPEDDILSYEVAKSYFDSESQEKISIANKNLDEHGTPYDLELRVIFSKNEELWIRNMVQPVYDEHKKIIAKRGVIQNITEEKNLRELNRQVASLAKIGSWEVNLLEDTIFWSEEVHLIHGTDPKKYKPKLSEAINFYREDFHELIKYNVEKCISNGESYDLEAVIITVDKNELWVRTNAKAEFINGVCTRIYGSFQNINERKQAEIAVQESEAKFRTIFEIASLGIAQVNPLNGEIVLVNSYYETITGYSEDELLKMKFSELTHPDDIEKDWELFRKAARGEEDYSNEKRYIKKDGSIVWVRIHLAFIRDENGNPKRTVAIWEDISNRKKVEQEKIRFQETLENSLNEIYIFDSETFKFTYVNKGALLNLGYSKKEIISATPINIKPEYTITSFKQLVEPLKNKELEKIIFFTNHKRKDGSIYPVEIHLTLVEEANYKNFIAIALDITEQKRAEEMYRLLADNTNDIIALQDPNKNLKYISPAVENLLGYKQDELLKKQFKEIIHKDDLGKIKEVVNNKLLKGIIIEAITYRAQHKKGYYIWLETLISPIIKDHKIVSLISTSRDISQWMSAKKEIEEYQSSLQKLTSEISLIEEKQKKEIAANIHDHLSQSLVISKMRITELEKKTELKNIQKDLQFIKSHVSNALENSRKITYELSPPVLYQLGIVDAIDWYAEETEEKYGIKFQFKTNVDSFKLSDFKSILIFRCIQEAVTNTIKYAEASLITLELIKDKKSVIILIKDNGKGFDTAVLNAGGSSDSGFGLFAVNERIKNMNGILTITSEIKIGTKIKIYVPLDL